MCTDWTFIAVVIIVVALVFLLLLCRSMKLWNAVHIMSSIGRIA